MVATTGYQQLITIRVQLLPQVIPHGQISRTISGQKPINVESSTVSRTRTIRT
jgi:hypothetical protein